MSDDSYEAFEMGDLRDTVLNKLKSSSSYNLVNRQSLNKGVMGAGDHDGDGEQQEEMNSNQDYINSQAQKQDQAIQIGGSSPVKQ